MTTIGRWELTGEPAEPLRLVEVKAPRPGPGQVLVELRAAALNYRDLYYADNPPRPGLVPLSDGAGEVVAVGEGVGEVAVGDRVVGSFFAAWGSGPSRHAELGSALGGDLDGVLSGRVVLEAGAVVAIPAGMSFAEAAAFPCGGVTAWHALVGHAFPLGAGDWVLTLGTGGVAMFALQIAKLRGARVVAMSSSERKRELLRELGADAVLDYRSEEDWERGIPRATAGHGVDFAIETGGAGTLQRSLEACAVGGCVTLVGVISGEAKEADAGLIHGRELTLRSVYVGPTTMLEAVLAAFAAAGERPLIDRSFAFADAPAAFARQRSGEGLGKVVIER